MTKKDFIRLADYLRHINWKTDEARLILGTICDFCKATNPRFDEEKFLGYLAGTCGPNGGAIKN